MSDSTKPCQCCGATIPFEYFTDFCDNCHHAPSLRKMVAQLMSEIEATDKAAAEAENHNDELLDQVDELQANLDWLSVPKNWANVYPPNRSESEWVLTDTHAQNITLVKASTLRDLIAKVREATTK